MNPKLYCVSLGDPWAFETYSHTCSLVQLLLTEPSLPLSLSPALSLSLSPSPPCRYPLCSSDIPISGPPVQPQPPHTVTHTQIHMCTVLTPPRLSPLVPEFRQPAWQPVTSAAGSAAVHHAGLAFNRAPCCYQDLHCPLPDTLPGPNKAMPGLWHEGDEKYGKGHEKKTWHLLNSRCCTVMSSASYFAPWPQTVYTNNAIYDSVSVDCVRLSLQLLNYIFLPCQPELRGVRAFAACEKIALESVSVCEWQRVQICAWMNE